MDPIPYKQPAAGVVYSNDERLSGAYLALLETFRLMSEHAQNLTLTEEDRVSVMSSLEAMGEALRILQELRSVIE